jgi:hypothetical protein
VDKQRGDILTRNSTSKRAISVQAVFPLYPPIRLHSDTHNELYYSFIDEFSKSRQFPVRGTDFQDSDTMSVRVSPCTKALQNHFSSKSELWLKTRHVLVFTGSFRFPGSEKFFFTDHEGKLVHQSEGTLESAWRDLLPSFLDTVIQTYLCALALAFRGAVTPTGCVWYVGGRIHHYSNHYVSAVPDGIEYVRKNDPTLISDVDCVTVVKWVFSQAGMFESYSNSPAAKALSYFTRLFTPEFRNDELSDTVWALAGIEALLVEGGRSSVGQLREKLTALFGRAENLSWLKSMTDVLYEFRSKMVHGNRHLRSAFREHESDESQKRFDEEYNSELFAIGILTALILRAISTGRSSFKFRTILDDPA